MRNCSFGLGRATAPVSNYLPRLLHVGPRLAALVVNGDVGNLREIKFLPGDARAFTIDDFQIPHFVLIAIVEINLDAFTIRQSLTTKHVFFPIVGAVWRKIQLVDLSARVIPQGKTM